MSQDAGLYTVLTISWRHYKLLTADDVIDSQ
jgi:hypothetical protein